MIFLADFSIFSHGGHLGWRAGSSDATFKGDHPRTIPQKFGLIGQVISEEKIFKIFFAEFSIFSNGRHLD